MLTVVDTNATSLLNATDKTATWLFDIYETDDTHHRWSTKDYTHATYGSYTAKIQKFKGIAFKKNNSDFGIHAPDKLTFSLVDKNHVYNIDDFIGGEVIVRLILHNADYAESEVQSWKFTVNNIAKSYGLMNFSCEDFLQQYLNGHWPNTASVATLSTSIYDTDQNDNYCVPVIYNYACIPLRCVNTSIGRAYIIGEASEYTATGSILNLYSPLDWDGTDGEVEFSDAQEQNVTINSVSYRVIKPLIYPQGAETEEAFFMKNNKFLDIIGRLSCDGNNLSSPSSIIKDILLDIGVPVADINNTSFTNAGTIYSSWNSLSWGAGFYQHEDKRKLLSRLLIECNSILRITDEIELIPLSKESQMTISSDDIIRNSYSSKNYTQKGIDACYAGIRVNSEVPQNSLFKTLVSPDTTNNPNRETINFSLVAEDVNAQRLGELYCLRKYYKKDQKSFSGKSFVCLVQPDDIITISGDNYASSEVGFENFLNYTEVDTYNQLIVRRNELEIVDYVSMDDTYIYRDFGVDYFDGDFSFHFKIDARNLTYNNNYAVTMPITLTNTLGEREDVDDYICLNFYQDGLGAGPKFAIHQKNDGTINYGSSFVISSEFYYINLIRDYDGGANSEGRITAYIRTESYSGTLVGTISVDCVAGTTYKDFRYIQLFTSFDDATTSSVSGMILNELNLNIDDDSETDKIEKAIVESVTINKDLSVKIHAYTYNIDFEDFDDSTPSTITIDSETLPDNIYSPSGSNLGYTQSDTIPAITSGDITATATLKGIQLDWVIPISPLVAKTAIRWRVWNNAESANSAWSSYHETLSDFMFRYLTDSEISTYGSDAKIEYDIQYVGPDSTYGSNQTAVVEVQGLNVEATDIDDFAITASKLHTQIPIPSGDTFTNNSPSAGYVAWNAHTIYYNGTAYSISSGSTQYKYIVWELASPSILQVQNTNPADFGLYDQPYWVIGVNNSGSFERSWHPMANAIIGSASIVDAAIVTAKIDDAAITTAKIDDLAVNNAKINDLSASKINAGSMSLSYLDGASGTLTITSAQIVVNTTEGIVVQSGGDITINEGGDLIFAANTSNQSKITFESPDTTTTDFGYTRHDVGGGTYYSFLSIEPATSGNDYFHIGHWSSWGNSWDIVGIGAESQIQLSVDGSTYDNIIGMYGSYIGIDCDNGTEAGKISVYPTYMSFEVRGSGASINNVIQYKYVGSQYVLTNTTSKSCDLGASSTPWDDVYYDDIHNQCLFLDDLDDLKILHSMSSKGTLHEDFNLPELSIQSLPVWMTNKDKLRKELKRECGELITDKDFEEMLLDDEELGYRYYRNFGNFTDLVAGAVRQLDRKLDRIINNNQLKGDKTNGRLAGSS